MKNEKLNNGEFTANARTSNLEKSSIHCPLTWLVLTHVIDLVPIWKPDGSTSCIDSIDINKLLNECGAFAEARSTRKARRRVQRV